MRLSCLRRRGRRYFVLDLGFAFGPFSPIPNRQLFHLSLVLELPDLLLQVVDDVLGLLHGGLHDAPLTTPPGNAFHLVLASAVLGLDLLA